VPASKRAEAGTVSSIMTAIIIAIFLLLISLGFYRIAVLLAKR
jgi:hypothetical protein